MPIKQNNIADIKTIKYRCFIHQNGQLEFELTNLEGFSIRRTIYELEKLYDQLKNDFLLLQKPPKRRLLLTETKLVEKRKIWGENILTRFIEHYQWRAEVRDFFGVLLINQEEDHINLGPTEKKTIKPADFDFYKCVGKGSFGRVFMVRYRANGKIYAMKVLGKEYVKKRNEVKHVMAERNVLLANVNHPFLVSLYYSFQTKDKLYFVLDFLNGGELFFHLQRERNFSEYRARFYSAEIASALGYLHQKNIIYRDLKPENLLLDRAGHVVLTDFGLCKEGIKRNDTTNTFCGTPEYLAPEVILKQPYDKTVDWWCLGSVLFEMLFGLPPFYSKNQKEMYEKTIYQPLRIPTNASLSARNIITQMLNKNRFERLGARFDFDEVKEHNFFSSTDWEKLLRRELRPPFQPKVSNEVDTVNIAKEFIEIEPNQESLAASSILLYGDKEFIGFTYSQPVFRD